MGLAGCASVPTPDGSATPAGNSVDASPGPDPSVPAEPELVRDGAADENLPFFASLIDQVWASDARASGRAYIDALVTGGFDKTTMQVTKDLSTVGNPAESMQVSVIWAGECLVGQFGPATGLPSSSVQAVLPGDVCLLGNTRPIDW